MEAWRKIWRTVAPMLPTAGLESLRTALLTDDPRLMQGGTVSPPPLQCVQDWPAEAACLLGFCGWQDGTDERTTVAEVEEFFSKTCFDLDTELQEPAGCRWLLNWFDETPRDEVRRELLPEVDRVIAERAALQEQSA